MRRPRTKDVLTFVVSFVSIIPEFIYAETCNRFHRKENVVVDSQLCLFENYTEPVPKSYYFESCFNKQWCSGFTTSPGIMVKWCCLVKAPEIQYRHQGNLILYYRKGIPVTCQTGWSGNDCDVCATNFGPPGICNGCVAGWVGDNCDTCALNFGPPGQCDACLAGWTGPECQYCEGFGFSTESGCAECIQNGPWSGKVGSKFLIVHLTFRGENCSELVPGTTTTVGYWSGRIKEGNLNEADNVLIFTNSWEYVYEGNMAIDKRIVGTAMGSLGDFEFSLIYRK